MSEVWLNEPPDPPGDYPWCFMCLHHAKQAQWEAFGSDIEAGKASEKPGKVCIPFPAGVKLREGRFRGVPGDAQFLGVQAGLCWDHMSGTGKPDMGPALDTSTRLPPGLLKGKR